MKKLLLVMIALTSLGTAVVVVKKINDRTVVEGPKENTPVAPPTTPTPPPPSDKVTDADYNAAIQSITETDAKQYLTTLTSKEMEGRMSGKRGNVRAAEFIKKKYESFGLPTKIDRFEIQRKNPGPHLERGDPFTQNVYAWIDGNDPVLKKEIVVVGAHFDHIGYGPNYSRGSGKLAMHPGADDNASGSSALLEIAQAFSTLKGKVKRTVVFQSYSAEEMGLLGSKHYCEHPLFPQDNPSIKSHVAMINLDMVGYLGQSDSKLDDSKMTWVVTGDLLTKYPFAKSITSNTAGRSDHASFFNKGVPVAFMNTGMHRNYHTPNDTPDRINYKGIEQVARYAFELSWQVSNRDGVPETKIR